ncbi:MAG: hypothetical protein LDLANPLL_01335 [Turneriella sp.]|nr:hypothetical protein [Turneriella sp.]
MLTLGVVLYILATLLVGFFAARKVKNNRDFALAGKNLSLFMATSTVFATWFGSETVLGSSASFVRDGFYGVIEEPFGAAICLILVGAIFAKKLYAMNLTTFGDFFRVRFGVFAEVVSSSVLAYSYVSWVAAQFIALGIVMQTVTGISLEAAILLMAALVALYTTMGGMWAVSLTDTLQTTLIIVGLVTVLLLLVPQAGGWEKIFSKVPASHFSFLPQGKIQWFHYVSLWIVLGFGSIPGQDVFQRVMSSKSGTVAAASSILAGFLYVSIAMIPLFLGLIATGMLTTAELPKDMQHLLPQVILLKTPLFIQIIFFGALLSAILSTASGALLAPSVLVSENLLRKVFPNEKYLLLLSRLSTIGIALWAAHTAYVERHIHDLVMDSSAIGLVALFVPFLVGFFTRCTNATVTVLSMSLGFLVWLFWEKLSLWVQIRAEDFPSAIAGFFASIIPYLFYFIYWLPFSFLRKKEVI